MASSSHNDAANTGPDACVPVAGVEAGPAAGKKRLRIWIGVCALVGVALFVSQLLEIPSRSAFRGYDNTFNYLWLRSAMVDHDWDFRNDLAQCNTLIPAYRASALALPPTATGHIPNKYGIGWAVVTTPFYFLADGVVALGRVLGWWSLERDGFNAVYQVCIQFGHAALAFAALVLAARTIARWIGDRDAALAGVVLVWAASPLLYYQTVDLSMNHGVAFFAVTLLTSALTRARETPDARWPWLLAGAGWGLAVITRFQLGVFGLLAAWTWYECSAGNFSRISAAVPCDESREPPRTAIAPTGLPLVVDVQRGGFSSRRISASAALRFVFGAAPFLLLQSFAWHIVYGKWLVFSYGAEGESFHWGKPEWWNSLFSPWHGLFYWHPFLFVATAGILAWAWQQRRRAAVLAVIFFATVYLNAAWWCWWFASSFGNRSYDAVLLLLMGGTAWLLARARGRGRSLIWCAAIVAGGWNFYVVLLYRTGAISRSAPVTWAQMLDAAHRLPEVLRF